MESGSPFPILLALLGVAAIAIIANGVVNGRKAMLDRLVPLEGEKTLLELDVTYSALLYQRALVTTLVYLGARLRVTDQRIIVAQKGLGSTKCVIRYIGYRSSQPPSDLQHGYPCFAIEPPNEVVDAAGQRELRIAPKQPAPIFPTYVAIRSERLDEIVRTLAA